MSLLNDIPLVHRHADDLLGIHADEDFWEWGWGFVPNLTFGAGIIENAVVILLHAPDEPEKYEGDVQIAFWVDQDEIDYLDEEVEVRTRLSKFLDARLPHIASVGIKRILNAMESNDLVLCVCNPLHSMIERPKSVPQGVNVHFPLGTVRHYKQGDFGQVEYLLEADEWVVL